MQQTHYLFILVRVSVAFDCRLCHAANHLFADDKPRLLMMLHQTLHLMYN